MAGLADAWGLSRLLTEVDDEGTITRELGFDVNGNVVHRHPGEPTRAKRGVFDLAEIASSNTSDMEPADFDRLWSAWVCFPPPSSRTGSNRIEWQESTLSRPFGCLTRTSDTCPSLKRHLMTDMSDSADCLQLGLNRSKAALRSTMKRCRLCALFC